MLQISLFSGRRNLNKRQAPKGLLNTYTPQTNLRFNEGSKLSTNTAKPQIAPGFSACVYTNINRLFIYAMHLVHTLQVANDIQPI